MTSGIYITTNKVNGRRYIGYSENIESRWRENIEQLDKGSAKSHPFIQSDWKKEGADAFCLGILEVLDTQEQALLSRRSQYGKNLLKPEYNQDKGSREYQQHITQEFALLAPVPEMHLNSGIEISEREGKVAFGCSNKEIFDMVDNLRKDTEVEVFIYASLTNRAITNQSIGAKVSWCAVYIGCVDAIEGKHPEGDKFRPESTRIDGNWNGFWEVRDLRPLPDLIEVSSLRGYARNLGENYSPNFVPRSPLLIGYPPIP